jgi:hypothetical protein
MEKPNRPIPKIDVGQYEGTPINHLPIGYCRWMLTQDFPLEWLEIAKAKVDASPLYKGTLVASMHAIDRFSLRFLRHWTEAQARNLAGCRDKRDGIATFLVKQAERAWEEGTDVSKKRHKRDGIVKEYKGILYVFKQSKVFPEYVDLITVMERSAPIHNVSIDTKA